MVNVPAVISIGASLLPWMVMVTCVVDANPSESTIVYVKTSEIVSLAVRKP